MEIRSLVVIHQRKGSAEASLLADRAPCVVRGDLFHLSSCQRQLWVTSGELAPIDPVVLRSFGLQVFQGVDAYRFLLRVAAGLESEILGETDIFGQVKEAWKNASATMPATLRSALSPWIQRLFEDTKEVRSRHLQNVGGASYGSLVRKLLGPVELRGPILLVGAGQIARSVAPYLVPSDDGGSGELWVWNRSRDKLDAFIDELKPAYRGRVRTVENDAEAEARAWREAVAVVICIPAEGESEAEARRRALFAQGRTGRPVIHLGGRRDECGAWSGLEGLRALDDLFALQKAQGDVRSLQIAQAGRACDERAKLRALGSSVSIPHGWEDLAVFA